MKKAGAIVIILLFIGAFAGNAFCEEIAKKGSNTAKSYFSGTSQVLALGQERLHINFEGSGVYVSDTGKGFMHLAAIHVMGTTHAVEGVFEETGVMVFTPTDGEKVFATYKASGEFGKPANGTWTITGGIGKYAGAGGGGEFTRYSLQNAAEGVWTSMNIVKGNYNLP